MTGRRVALALAGAAVVLAGCGSATGSEAGAGVSESSAAGNATSLTITWDDGAGKTGTWHLTCDGPGGKAGGDHPDPDAACAALAKGGGIALQPVKPGMMCAEIYGGPQTATLSGTWQGRAVSARLRRTDGCEIRRWNALKGLLPDA